MSPKREFPVGHIRYPVKQKSVPLALELLRNFGALELGFLLVGRVHVPLSKFQCNEMCWNLGLALLDLRCFSSDDTFEIILWEHERLSHNERWSTSLLIAAENAQWRKSVPKLPQRWLRESPMFGRAVQAAIRFWKRVFCRFEPRKSSQNKATEGQPRLPWFPSVFSLPPSFPPSLRPSLPLCLFFSFLFFSFRFSCLFSSLSFSNLLLSFPSFLSSFLPFFLSFYSSSILAHRITFNSFLLSNQNSLPWVRALSFERCTTQSTTQKLPSLSFNQQAGQASKLSSNQAINQPAN